MDAIGAAADAEADTGEMTSTAGPAFLARRRAFAAMERRHALFDYRAGGWSPWRVVRGTVQRLVLEMPQGRIERPTLVRSVEALAATARLLRLFAFARPRRLLVKSSRAALRLKQHDRYRDVYFDGLLAEEPSHFKLEDVNSSDFGRQAAAALYPGDLNPAAFTFWGRLLGTIFPHRAALPFCRAVASAVQEQFGVALSPNWLLLRVSTVAWQARLYEWLLRRLRPAAVLVSDTSEFGLRLACSRRLIPFVELQHGIFDAGHPDAVPADVAGTADELLLPEALACWGEFWRDQLAGSRQARIAVPVGNELVDVARARRARRPGGGPRRLVFTSQDRADQAATWLMEAVRAAPDGLDWRLTIKLHPFYEIGAGAFGALVDDPRVQVLGGSVEPNTLDLLTEADLHLSISSACLFDAAALGTRSAVLPLSGHEQILYAADGAAITVCDDPAQIWRILAEGRNVPGDGRGFCEPDFVANMKQLVDRLAAPRETGVRAAGKSSESG